MTTSIIETILKNAGLVQAGVWIHEADKSKTNYKFHVTTDNGFEDFIDTDEQLKGLAPDSDYFK